MRKNDLRLDNLINSKEASSNAENGITVSRSLGCSFENFSSHQIGIGHPEEKSIFAKLIWASKITIH